MKILSVKLTNLNSLRGRHEVSFQTAPLAGVGLFAITGPTGAGKSTLLDAITLALYGKAARYKDTPSPEDMMSRHCGECAAEVEFQVSSGIYRAEWQLRRAHGKTTGKVQAAKRYVYDGNGQPMAQSVRETEALIEQLIGLDYSRFLRSALLAQGDFAQFLKAKPDERAELLESLTGTSIYSELGTLAHSETGRRETELRTKEDSIRNIQLLEEPQRLKLAADLAAADTMLSQARHDLQQANELLNKATNLATALDQERQALQKQQVLKAERKQAEKDLQRLSQHRLTIPFQGDLAKLDSGEQDLSTARSQLNQAKRSHSEALRNAYRTLGGLRQMIAGQIASAQRDLNGCDGRISAAMKRETDSAEWLQQHHSDRGLADALTDLVSDLGSLKGARRNLEREWNQLRKLATKLNPNQVDELPKSAADLTKAAAKEISAQLTKMIRKWLATVDSAEKTAEGELKLREDHLKQAQLVASFEVHRANLKKGEVCPLCGAQEHPFTEGAEPSFPFKKLEGLVNAAKEICQKLAKEYDDLDTLCDELQVAGKNLLPAIDECREILDLLTPKLKSFALTIPAAGEEDDTKAVLQNRAREYSQHSTEAANAERDRVAATNEQTQLKSRLKALEEKQSALAQEAIPEPAPGETVDFDAEEVLRSWSTLAAAEKDWDAARSNLTVASTTLDTRQKDNAQAAKKSSDLSARLSARLTESAFTGIDTLRAARLANEDAAQIEESENALKNREQSVEADRRVAHVAIAKWRAESAPENEAVNELKERQKASQNRLEELIRNQNTWRNVLSQDDAYRQAVSEKQKQLAGDRERLVVWQRLRGLIGSHDGRVFRRYAQAVSLDVLVLYANRQLLRLNDRYQLRRREGDELDLEIEDLHQAGAIRPMASLSGGESFLASLALALGLSDIAGRKVRIESLFIDEGFGSLDSDTLDVAISALETLRHDNKTVGVISHVDLLKERIAAQIIVEKQPGGTSCLRIAS